MTIMNYIIIYNILDLSHICNGLLPILYNIDKKPLWYVFANIIRSQILKLIILFLYLTKN
jgi:hypothetical protein